MDGNKFDAGVKWTLIVLGIISVVGMSLYWLQEWGVF